MGRLAEEDSIEFGLESCACGPLPQVLEIESSCLYV